MKFKRKADVYFYFRERNARFSFILSFFTTIAVEF